jgi:hypothetical protein
VPVDPTTGSSTSISASGGPGELLLQDKLRINKLIVKRMDDVFLTMILLSAQL